MAVTREDIASRVRAAIEALGREQKEVAHAIGVDPSALSRSLSGQRDFKSVEIAMLAEVLSVPSSFLLEGRHNRQPVKMAARVQQGVSAAVTTALDRADVFARTHLMLSDQGYEASEFAVGADLVRGTAWGQGDALAAKTWGFLGGPVELPRSLDDFATYIESSLDIDVAFEPLASGLDGLSVVSGTLRLALVSSATPTVRRRWTLAHEVGHIIAGDSDLWLDEKLFHVKSDEETRANAFAASFLMPEVLIRERWNNSGKDEAAVLDLLDTYRVSLDAVAYRLHNLRLIDAQRRDDLRARRSLFNLYRESVSDSRQAQRPPGLLLDRCLRAFDAGDLGVGPLADVVAMDADDLLDFLESDEAEADAMNDPSSRDVA